MNKRAQFVIWYLLFSACRIQFINSLTFLRERLCPSDQKVLPISATFLQQTVKAISCVNLCNVLSIDTKKIIRQVLRCSSNIKRISREKKKPATNHNTSNVTPVTCTVNGTQYEKNYRMSSIKHLECASHITHAFKRKRLAYITSAHFLNIRKYFPSPDTSL